MTKTYRYFIRFDMREAYEDGYKDHPQIEMNTLAKDMDFKIQHYEPVSIADCWMFWIKSKKPIIFPKHITILDWFNYNDWRTGKRRKHKFNENSKNK